MKSTSLGHLSSFMVSLCDFTYIPHFYLVNVRNSEMSERVVAKYMSTGGPILFKHDGVSFLWSLALEL